MKTKRRWSYVLRGTLAVITCVFGYLAGDFATFLNLQGSLVGSIISYVLPCVFYLRMCSVNRALKARKIDQGKRNEMDGSLVTSNPYDEMNYATRYTSLDVSVQVPETPTEVLTRWLCCTIIIYGIVGGSISFLATGLKIFS